MRRSARTSSKNNQALAATLQDEDGDEDVKMEAAYQSEEDVDDESEKNKPKKRKRHTKRKNAVSGNENQAPTKRLRGNRGLLKEVLQMPVDVLVEIFGCLDPLDLIHLTWTTKEFRSLLLTKNSDSRAIWRASFSNIPGFPPCPEDMSEPRYAHLAFVKACHRCDRKIPSVKIIWYARTRLCRRCIEEEFDTPSHRLPDPAYMFSECVPSHEVEFRKHRFSNRYHTKTCNMWVKEYHTTEDKKEWIANKRELQERLMMHAEACESWLRQYEDMLITEKTNAIEARKTVVVDHLTKLGWGEELSKIESKNNQPAELASVIKACQKDITDKTLATLEPILNAHMSRIKRNRLKKECEELVTKRLPLLKEVYDAHLDSLPANSIYPGIADVFCHPDVYSFTTQKPEVDLTFAHLDGIRSSLSDIFSHLREVIEKRIIALIPAAFIPPGVNGHELLNLATISFECSYHPCLSKREMHQATMLRFPEIISHPCATSYNMNFTIDPAVETCDGLISVIRKLQSVPWNGHLRIKFAKQAFTIIQDAMGMCGRDPLTTTTEEMNIENPIFECLTCHDDYKGRTVVPWDYLPSHKESKHRNSEMSFALVEEPNASIAKVRLLEQQQRAWGAKEYGGMICMHCKKTGNTIDLTKHVKNDHKTPDVTKKDIAHWNKRSGYGEASTIFCLWPPKEATVAEAKEAAPAAQ